MKCKGELSRSRWARGGVDNAMRILGGDDQEAKNDNNQQMVTTQ